MQHSEESHASTMFVAPNRRDALGIAASAAAAGPTSLIAVVAWMAAMHSDSPRLGPLEQKDLIGFALVFGLSCIYGLVGGIPAAILNSLAQLALAKRQMDAAVVGALCGGLVGASIGYVAISAAIYDPRYDTSLELMSPLGISGALMGLLYWSIAVRPRRKLRLAQRLAI